MHILSKVQLAWGPLLAQTAVAADAAGVKDAGQSKPFPWMAVAFSVALTAAGAHRLGGILLDRRRQSRLKKDLAQHRERAAVDYWDNLGMRSPMPWGKLAPFCLDHPKYGILAQAKNPEALRKPLEQVKRAMALDLHPAEMDPNLSHALGELARNCDDADVRLALTLSSFSHTTKELKENPAAVSQALDRFIGANQSLPSADKAGMWRRVLDYAPAPAIQEPPADLAF
jgi:hypothetical protein